MPQSSFKILFSAEKISERVQELAAQINKDYQGQSLHVIGVLNGSFLLIADLVRKLAPEVTLDFMAVSSYKGTEKQEQHQVTKDLKEEIQSKHVLVVEDICDTGKTLEFIKKILTHRKPQSLKFMSLLYKPHNSAFHLDYYGFSVGEGFVVGYGLDWNEKYRNLPYIGVV